MGHSVSASYVGLVVCFFFLTDFDTYRLSKDILDLGGMNDY
jgi:hypothetical protein